MQVVVTGTDRGLGFSLVKTLLERGAVVTGGHRDPLTAEHLELGKKHPGRLVWLPLDVADDAGVAEFAGKVLHGTPEIDLLINNAGVLGEITATIADPLDIADMQRSMNVNAYGPLRVIQALLPGLRKGTEKVIANISSEAGSITRCRRDSWFGYCMSKTALNMGAKIAFNTLKEEGFVMLQFHPGWMRTWMSGRLNTEATYSPNESAVRITDLIETHKTDKMEEPLYIDIEGEQWPW